MEVLRVCVRTTPEMEVNGRSFISGFGFMFAHFSLASRKQNTNQINNQSAAFVSRFMHTASAKNFLAWGEECSVFTFVHLILHINFALQCYCCCLGFLSVRFFIQPKNPHISVRHFPVCIPIEWLCVACVRTRPYWHCIWMDRFGWAIDQLRSFHIFHSLLLSFALSLVFPAVCRVDFQVDRCI